MRKVYGINIDFPESLGLEQRLSNIILIWIKEILTRRGYGGLLENLIDDIHGKFDTYRDGISIYHAKINDQDGFLSHYTVIERGTEDPSILWQTEIYYLSTSKRQVISIELFVASAEDSFRPLRASVRPPRLVRELIAIEGAVVGGVPVDNRALPFGSSQAHDLIQILRTPGRRLPIVVLSPRPDGSAGPVDADRVADRLRGVAITILLTDIDITYQVSDELGSRLSCYDGGVRIYWPGFHDGDSPYRHPLFLRWDLEQLDNNKRVDLIARPILEVVAFRHTRPIIIESFRVSAEEKERLKINEKLKEKTDIDEILAENIKRGEQISRLEKELSEVRAQNDSLREQVSRLPDRTTETILGAIEPSLAEPKSMLDALEIAERECKWLRFTEECRESAMASPFRNVRRVLDLLRAADDVAKQLFEREGGDPRLLFKGRGFEFKPHISQTAAGKNRNDYTFNVFGERKMVEGHFRIGKGNPQSCMNAFVDIDVKSKSLIFVHLGLHKPVTDSG